MSQVGLRVSGMAAARPYFCVPANYWLCVHFDFDAGVDEATRGACRARFGALVGGVLYRDGDTGVAIEWKAAGPAAHENYYSESKYDQRYVRAATINLVRAAHAGLLADCRLRPEQVAISFNVTQQLRHTSLQNDDLSVGGP